MFTERQRHKILMISLTILVMSLIVPFLVHADLLRYTNSNYFTAAHEQPVSFRSDGYGGFIGYTESGRLFRQFPVVTNSTVRLHRFEIDDAYFYISDRGIITATSDLGALSVYYSLAPTGTSAV